MSPTKNVPLCPYRSADRNVGDRINCELTAVADRETDDRFDFEEDGDFDFYERAAAGSDDCTDGTWPPRVCDH